MIGLGTVFIVFLFGLCSGLTTYHLSSRAYPYLKTGYILLTDLWQLHHVVTGGLPAILHDHVISIGKLREQVQTLGKSTDHPESDSKRNDPPTSSILSDPTLL